MLDDCALGSELSRVEDVQGVLLRLVLVDLEWPLCEFAAGMWSSLRLGMGQGLAEDEGDREVDIWRGVFLWADGVCGLGVLDGRKLSVELSRVEDVQVAVLRLVLVRPLSVGRFAADM